MIAAAEIRRMSRAKLLDARVLYWAMRFDSAFYLCGYAVELALKARICQTLGCQLPETSHEFRRAGLQQLQTHDFEDLLQQTGIETQVKTQRFAEWSTVLLWDSAKRYQPTGRVRRRQARNMLTSTKRLLTVIV